MFDLHFSQKEKLKKSMQFLNKKKKKKKKSMQFQFIVTG